MEEGEQKVKLLGALYSPFSMRVEWALKLKKIKYEFVEQDLANKSSLLLNSNPIHKKIPVLIHNQKPICESVVIVEYVDETWKHDPILPLDPYQKAAARFWAKFANEKCTEAVRRVICTKGEQQEKEVNQAKQAMGVLEGELRGKKFFGGETVGLVDIVFGLTSIWLEVIEEVSGVQIFDSEKCPCIHKWMENFKELPVIKEKVPPREILVRSFQNIRQKHTN